MDLQEAGAKGRMSLTQNLQGNGDISAVEAFFVIVMLQTATIRIAVAFSARTAWLTDGFYLDMAISTDT